MVNLVLMLTFVRNVIRDFGNIIEMENTALL